MNAHRIEPFTHESRREYYREEYVSRRHCHPDPQHEARDCTHQQQQPHAVTGNEQQVIYQRTRQPRD